MKRLIVSLAIGVMVASSAWAGAGFGFFGSMWDADDAPDMAFGGGAKFKLEVAQNFYIELRGSYFTRFAKDGPNEDMAVIPAEADLIIELPIAPDQIMLYGGGGGGYYIIPEYTAKGDIDGIDDPDVDFDDDFGWFLIGGLEIKLSETAALFGEGIYRFLEVDKAELNGHEVDLDAIGETAKFNGFGANAGILIYF